MSYWRGNNTIDLTDERQKGRLQQLLKISKHLDDMQNQQDFSKYGYESVSGMEQDAQKGFELVKRIRNAQATKDQNAQVTKDKEAQAIKDKEATKDKEAKDKRLAKISDQHLLKMQQQYEKLKAIADENPENKRAQELLKKLKASLEKHQLGGHKFAEMPTQVDKYDSDQSDQIANSVLDKLTNNIELTNTSGVIKDIIINYLSKFKKTEMLDNFTIQEGMFANIANFFYREKPADLKKQLEIITKDMDIDTTEFLENLSTVTGGKEIAKELSDLIKYLKKQKTTLKELIDKAIREKEQQ